MNERAAKLIRRVARALGGSDASAVQKARLTLTTEWKKLPNHSARGAVRQKLLRMITKCKRVDSPIISPEAVKEAAAAGKGLIVPATPAMAAQVGIKL